MADTMTRQVQGRPRPMLGLRRRPGRIALVVFRMPLQAYRHGQGRLLGHTFALLTHAGRRTGQPHSTVAMVLRYEPRSHEVVICSAWGPGTDWFRNIKARPALRVDVGSETFAPEQRFLTEDESYAVLADCLRRHPWRFRFMARVFGWGDLRSGSVARDFVRARPFVSFRPAGAPVDAGPGATPAPPRLTAMSPRRWRRRSRHRSR